CRAASLPDITAALLDDAKTNSQLPGRASSGLSG
ncbi:MAG: hypothetical protein ACI9MJ_001997, partial [Alphaproteobacteria bacterium]